MESVSRFERDDEQQREDSTARSPDSTTGSAVSSTNPLHRGSFLGHGVFHRTVCGGARPRFSSRCWKRAIVHDRAADQHISTAEE